MLFGDELPSTEAVECCVVMRTVQLEIHMLWTVRNNCMEYIDICFLA